MLSDFSKAIKYTGLLYNQQMNFIFGALQCLVLLITVFISIFKPKKKRDINKSGYRLAISIFGICICILRIIRSIIHSAVANDLKKYIQGFKKGSTGGFTNEHPFNGLFLGLPRHGHV